MVDLAQREQLLDEVFDQYDFFNIGELSPEQLQMIHSDIRPGTISIQQIKESIKYVCVHNVCEKSELFDVLQEMDRRYYLTENYRWEFSMLDTENKDTIAEDQARWFMENAHAPYFSSLRWQRFVKRRAVPGSGVSFAEIEVPLCNIPSKEDWLADLEQERREQEEEERRLRELERKAEEERRRKKLLHEEERNKREDEEMKRKLEMERRRREEEEERQQQLRDKKEAAHRKKMLEEEEERGQREAEERERKRREQKEMEDKERRQKEEEELKRLEQLELEHREEEEKRKVQELKEAEDYEDIIKEIDRREKEAAKEEEKHHLRLMEAGDDHVKRDAEEAEERARVKKRECRNKRIRYNLKLAIKRRDHARLPKAAADFKNSKLPDDDLDLPKADRILREFKARDGLVNAINNRQLKPLEHAISYVKHNGFELQLHKELIEANKVLLHLRRLERIRAEILELKQSTVAEIRSYQKPPPVVHVVMTATFLILGHREKETKDWKTVQALVGKTGKEGLKRRCLECEPLKIVPEAAARAKQLLSSHELDEIRDVSAGAATFYLWSWTMIEESEAQREAKKREEEERKKIQEEKRLRREEILRENPDAVFSDDEEPKKSPKTPSGGEKAKKSKRSQSLPPAKTQSERKRSKSVDSRPAERGRKPSTTGAKNPVKVTAGVKKSEGKVVTSDNKDPVTKTGEKSAVEGKHDKRIGDEETDTGSSVAEASAEITPEETESDGKKTEV
ncbi:hypothetical protein LSH36_101g03021 [Paralvinella palmiformis]|uniref:Uncharacterized protein n=1 Tax=Paralvinella palmiformis TaxID=53620 RepID=A0AAD9N9N6_9ANNE|nr:hypothetical protein LSH36_101g03021 [Paralvinella palmiformis]